MRNFSDLQRDAEALRSITLPLKTRGVKVVSGIAAVLLISAFAQIKSDPLLAVIGIPLMAFLLFIMVKMWRRPERTSLVLDSEGITHSVFSRKVNIRWSEIQGICAAWPQYVLYEVPWNRQVVIHYRRDDQDKRFTIAPRLFGMSAEKVVALMDPYYQSARNVPRAEDAGVEKLPSAENAQQ